MTIEEIIEDYPYLEEDIKQALQFSAMALAKV